MKPGTIKTDQVGQVLLEPPMEVERIDSKQPVVLDERTIPDGRSQLPQVPPSRTDSLGESPLVRGRVDTTDEGSKKGKRQKLLKVAEAKTLNKPGRTEFRSAGGVLDGGVEKLRRRKDAPADFGAEDA